MGTVTRQCDAVSTVSDYMSTHVLHNLPVWSRLLDTGSPGIQALFVLPAPASALFD